MKNENFPESNIKALNEILVISFYHLHEYFKYLP